MSGKSKTIIYLRIFYMEMIFFSFRSYLIFDFKYRVSFCIFLSLSILFLLLHCFHFLPYFFSLSFSYLSLIIMPLSVLLYLPCTDQFMSMFLSLSLPGIPTWTLTCPLSLFLVRIISLSLSLSHRQISLSTLQISFLLLCHSHSKTHISCLSLFHLLSHIVPFTHSISFSLIQCCIETFKLW